MLRAANYLNDNFAGKEISEIQPAGFARNWSRPSKAMNQLMIDTVTFAQRALDAESNSSGFVMKGETKLMNYDELSDIDRNCARLFDAFSQQREILGLLDRSIAADGVQIFIGEESGYQMLDNCSIVTAPYKIDDDMWWACSASSVRRAWPTSGSSRSSMSRPNCSALR